MANDPKKFRYDSVPHHQKPPEGLAPQVNEEKPKSEKKTLTAEQQERRKKLLAQMKDEVTKEEEEAQAEQPSNLPYDVEEQHPAELVEEPESEISKYRVSLSNALETPHMKSIRFGVIGTGQCGGRLAEVFARFGYSVCAINTAEQDLAYLDLPDSNKLLMPYALGGAGKNLLIGQQAAVENLEGIKGLLGNTMSDVDQVLITVGGGGGCIHEDSYVVTDQHGLIRFGDLYQDYLDRGFEEMPNGTSAEINIGFLEGSEVVRPKTFSYKQNGHKGESSFERVEIAAITQHGVPRAETREVVLDNGGRLVTSAWHLFFVLENGRIVEKRADELEEEDLLLRPNTSMLKEAQTEAVSIETLEKAWLTGLILGDGAFVDSKAKSLRIHSDTREVLDKADTIIRKYYQTEGQINYEEDRHLYIYSTGVVQTVEAIRKECEVEFGKKDDVIEVPSWIVKGFSKHTILAFLAGYLDADGWVTDRFIAWGSISEKRINQVVGLVNLLGLQGGSSSWDPNDYELERVTENWSKNFIARVARDAGYLAGLLEEYVEHPKRKERLSDLKKGLARRSIYVNRDWLLDICTRLGVNFFVKNRTVKSSTFKVSLSDLVNKRSKALTLEKIYALRDLMLELDVAANDVEAWREFCTFVNNVNNVTAVKSIRVPEEVSTFYDFYIPETQNYIAGQGCFSVIHNSGGGSVVPLLEAVMNTEEISGLPIVVIYTLPMNDEGAAAKSNAVKTLERIAAMVNDDLISSLIIVDNAKIQQNYPSVSVKDFWELANFDIVNHFNMFNTVSKCGTNYDALDPMDFANIISTGGCLIYGRVEVPVIQNGQVALDENLLAKALVRGINEGTLAEGFDVTQAVNIGVIITGSEEVLSQIPAVNVNYAFNVLAENVGEDCSVYRGMYADDTATDTITVYTIFAGLGLPSQRVARLKEEADSALQRIESKKKKTKLSLSDDDNKQQQDPYAQMRQNNTSMGRMIQRRRRGR